MATTTIYFATNRKPNKQSKPTNFGRGFSRTDLGDVRFGEATVINGSLNTNPMFLFFHGLQMVKSLRILMTVMMRKRPVMRLPGA